VEKLDFSLKLVTPAFLAGAMEKDLDAAEVESLGVRAGDTPPRHRVIGPQGDGLRVPSLRGVLRFWFRAKEALVGDDEIDELKQREAAIFGSTECGQGLRIVPVAIPDWIPAPIEAGTASAESYLGYGPLNYRRRPGGGSGASSYNKSSHRDAIPAGTTFGFRAFGSARQIAELKKCLILLHLFGGVGARSRRGWGSIAVEAEFLAGMILERAAKSYFPQLLEAVWGREVPSGRRPGGLATNPRHTAFSQAAQVWVSDGFSFGTPEKPYLAVFMAFFERFQKTRLWRVQGSTPCPLAKKDHDGEAADAGAGTLTYVPKRVAFGLPYHPQSRVPGGAVRWEIAYRGRPRGSVADSKEDITRRASPLFLKVIPGSDGRLSGVALYLPGHFFGRDGFEIAAESTPGTLPPPDGEAILDFLKFPEPQAAPPPPRAARKPAWMAVQQRLHGGPPPAANGAGNGLAGQAPSSSIQWSRIALPK
jgi:CRISPR-associated protein Cmr1